MLADIYDALRSARPYKPAFDRETTRQIILQGDGRTHPRHFDPEVYNVFKKVESLLHEIYESYRGKDCIDFYEEFRTLP